MTRFLRTAPTRRLLSTLAAAVAIVGGGTAIALAAGGGGPVPAPKPLPRAIHDALTAPSVAGITARITFTNHLIDSADIQGADPLLNGAKGRLWLAPGHRLRIELQGENGDAELVVNNRSFWVSDPSSNTVYEGTLPARSPDAAKPGAQHESAPTIAAITRQLQSVAAHLDISGATASDVGTRSATRTDVAGRPAYGVTVSPRANGGLFGFAQLAWDAVTGVPLRFAIYARNDNSTPVIELTATDISFGAVPASDFQAAPPTGAKVVQLSTSAAGKPSAAASGARPRQRAAEISGLAAVRSKLPFSLDAPASLGGMSRNSVRLVAFGGHPAALIGYGRGLGGLLVLEQAATTPTAAGAPASGSAGSDRHQGLSLPTVKVAGATAQELNTALGTLVHFDRAGVSYTLVGSVARGTAEAASRAL